MNCERYIWAGGEDRLCGQKVGLIHWWSVDGPHAACRNHVGVMQRLYPVTDPPMPDFLHGAPDPIDSYKSWTDAGWTEAELREAFAG